MLDAPKSIHPFPAKMAPELALRHLSSRKCLNVLDPMVGSGTVVRIAHELGHKALGFDTDPLALMIAESWCHPPAPSEFKRAAQSIAEKASNWRSIPARLAYPNGAGPETRKFIRYWFDLKARRQLSALVCQISKVRKRSLRLYLLTAVSKTIIVKQNGVSLARDVAHSRPHKAYVRSPKQPLASFQHAAAQLFSSLSPRAASDFPKVRRGDARDLPLRANSIDLVVTSPPYLNAIDYLRGHKFSLVWFGYQVEEIRKLRSSNIGAEVALAGEHRNAERLIDLVVGKRTLPARKKQMLKRYVVDIAALMGEIHRVLRPRGKCVLVVGDSSLDGVFVRNSRLVKEIANSSGLRFIREYRRRIPDSRRYLPPPSSQRKRKNLALRMRTEVVLVFAVKSAGVRVRSRA